MRVQLVYGKRPTSCRLVVIPRGLWQLLGRPPAIAQEGEYTASLACCLGELKDRLNPIRLGTFASRIGSLLCEFVGNARVHFGEE